MVWLMDKGMAWYGGMGLSLSLTLSRDSKSTGQLNRSAHQFPKLCAGIQIKADR